MYQALYRKYRSQTFSEMVGQEVVATTLKQAVAQETISHAYLFSGPRGTGKTSAAKIFAKAMNCPHSQDGEPCNNCEICEMITNGSLDDVIEIDAASNNGVDEIRDIRDKSTYAPTLATYKVYIIDEVHMLSTGAFNALLKTLEEPTNSVVFILATTELHKIPATILSRVQRLAFKAIQTADIKHHLASVLEAEGIDYEEPALEMIAKSAEGGMRDALSILDQAVSLSQDSGVTLAISEDVTGAISLEALDSYVTHIRHQDELAALKDLDIIFANGKSMVRFATDLLQYLRDILLAQVGSQEVSDRESFISQISWDKDAVLAAIDQVTDSFRVIKTSPQPKIYAEAMTMRLARSASRLSTDMSALESEIASLKQQVSQFEARLSQLSASQSQTQDLSHRQTNSKSNYRIDEAKVYQVLQEAIDQPDLARQNLIRLQEAWGEILENLEGPDRAILKGSEPVAASQTQVILAFSSRYSAEQAMKRDNLHLIFGNTLNQAAGFSPKILALSKDDWKHLRQSFKEGYAWKQNTEKRQTNPLPEDWQFLGTIAQVVED